MNVPNSSRCPRQFFRTRRRCPRHHHWQRQRKVWAANDVTRRPVSPARTRAPREKRLLMMSSVHHSWTLPSRACLPGPMPSRPIPAATFSPGQVPSTRNDHLCTRDPTPKININRQVGNLFRKSASGAGAESAQTRPLQPRSCGRGVACSPDRTQRTSIGLQPFRACPDIKAPALCTPSLPSHIELPSIHSGVGSTWHRAVSIRELWLRSKRMPWFRDTGSWTTSVPFARVRTRSRLVRVRLDQSVELSRRPTASSFLHPTRVRTTHSGRLRRKSTAFQLPGVPVSQAFERLSFQTPCWTDGAALAANLPRCCHVLQPIEGFSADVCKTGPLLLHPSPTAAAASCMRWGAGGA